MLPRRPQTARKQDQRERNDADVLGEDGVVEGDPARPFLPRQHPQSRKQHERWNPKAGGDLTGSDGGKKQQGKQY